MSQVNQKTGTIRTHEGATAKHISPLAQLRRSVMACMLWENSFYEDGQSIADRIRTLAAQVTPEQLSALAIEARTRFKLRHVPLLLTRELARRGGKIVGDTLYQVINRADELAEFLAIYWSEGKCPLSKQVKLGLARAFRKFDEYQLAKYNRKNTVKLKDVIRMVRPIPLNDEQSAIWKRLVADELRSPDTWEVALSGGADKGETFTRLLSENKLGYMALLRNLRNMLDSGVNVNLIKDRLREGARKSKALPFRFVAAANAAPALFEPLSEAMQLSLDGMERLPGKTIVLVDVSGSMDWNRVSQKSELKSIDAAAALAGLVVGVSDHAEVYTFSNHVVQVPSAKGLGIVRAVLDSQAHCGTDLGGAVRKMMGKKYDRLIVLTDEQSHTRVPDPKSGRNYMINVATYKNGVGYGAWTHIDGFSEAVIDWIRECEK